jgi:hypothetical protein
MVYADGTFEIDYEYEFPEGVSSGITFINQTVEYERKSSGRLLNQTISNMITGTIYKSRRIQLKEKPGLFKYGKDSKIFDILNKEGYTVGNVLVVTFDKIVFTYTIIGIYISDPEIWTELFKEKLDKAKSYSPGFYKMKY